MLGGGNIPESKVGPRGNATSYALVDVRTVTSVIMLTIGITVAAMADAQSKVSKVLAARCSSLN